MYYPPTTNYLRKKLKWMARKLKAMNDLPAIKDWTDVMNCVFDTLQAISKGKDLSAQCRGQRVIGKFTKHIVLLMPLHKKGHERREGSKQIRETNNQGEAIICSKEVNEEDSSQDG